MHALTAELKLLYPRWRIQPYAVGGMGPGFFDVNDKTGTGLLEDDSTSLFGRLGAGFDFYATDNLVFNTEFAGSLSTADFRSVSDLPYMTLGFGLHWRF